MLQWLPREIRSQIAGYMSDDLQAVDPRCYRGARTLQAAWRGRLTRLTLHAYYCSDCLWQGNGDMCEDCARSFSRCAKASAYLATWRPSPWN